MEVVEVAVESRLAQRGRRVVVSAFEKPIMIEVPPARIPEEPGAVIPRTGI